MARPSPSYRRALFIFCNAGASVALLIRVSYGGGGKTEARTQGARLRRTLPAPGFGSAMQPAFLFLTRPSQSRFFFLSLGFPHAKISALA